MPKYLIQATHSPEGLKGLIKDTASGRKAAVEKAVASLGGKVESMHYAFGEYDVVLIVEGPDNVTTAARGIAVSSTGLTRTTTTPLLTVVETDQALKKAVTYRGPGQ
jgi:uncharacterized protein with GYD domain